MGKLKASLIDGVIKNEAYSAENEDADLFYNHDGFYGEGLETKEESEDTDYFRELYEESLKGIREGEVVKGEVAQINKGYVLVDIGYKSEGQIPIEEFIDSEGNLTAKVGEKVDVVLERRENDEGNVILSREKASKIKIWDDIKDIHKSGGVIKGRILSRVKGGLSVDIGLKAFLPGSQIDLRPVRHMDLLIGTEHDFRVLKYNKRRGNIVLSRRAILEAERAALRKKILPLLKKRAVLEGTVKNIADYGLFVDLGGIDGLVHITEMSWGRVNYPSELYQVGDTLMVKVLSFDRQKERVSLSIKQLTPDPWNDAEKKYPVGTRIKGRIVSLRNYGAFVEVEPGVEGLIHISEMSRTKKITRPSQMINLGDIVECAVLRIDGTKKRISLSMKQVEPNPWDDIEEKYPVGTIIDGKIKNITDFGMFMGIDEGIDGLVHISDISWTKAIKHPSELYKKGQEIQAVVLNIDKEREHLSLGIKQLSPDPWDEIPEKYGPGSRVTGKVTNKTDFGVFMQIEEGIEGLIHISEIPKDNHGNPISQFQVNDEIKAKVLNVSREEKKMRLSIRKLEEDTDEDIQSDHLDPHNAATSYLGEILREILEKERTNVDKEAGPESQEE